MCYPRRSYGWLRVSARGGCAAGHWTHYALLQRTLYSIMDEVYEFVRRPPSGPVAIPQGVRRELAMLGGVSSAGSGGSFADWCPVVSMVDAGPQLGLWFIRSSSAPTSPRKDAGVGDRLGIRHASFARARSVVQSSVAPRGTAMAESGTQQHNGGAMRCHGCSAAQPLPQGVSVACWS